MTRYTAPLVLAMTLLGPATGAAQDRVHQQMMAELRMLQEQQQQLQQLMGSLAETLRALNAKLDDQGNATRRAFADQKLTVDNMAEGVRILREKADDTGVRLSALTQELEVMRQSLAAAPVYSPGASTGEPNTGDPSAPPGSALLSGVSVQRQYDISYGDFVIGQYDLAISGFEEFIRQFPRSAMADEAQLNIGNSYLNSGRYKEAAAAFQRVIAEYPDSDSMPAAYYKLGEAYRSLNQPDDARKAWEAGIQRYPDASESILARQALERLKRR